MSQASVLTNELRALEETIAATTVKMVPLEEQKQAVEAAGRRHLDWSHWRIALNVQHPRYGDIRAALREASIRLSELFGESDGDSDGEPPSRWIISINRKMPTTHKLALLELAMRFNFDGFQFWRPVQEAGETEDVYIGSYGFDNYVALTREFANLLDATFEEVDLVAYMRKHRAGGIVNE